MKKMIAVLLLVLTFLFCSCAALTTTKYDPVLIPAIMEQQFGLATKLQVDTQYTKSSNTMAKNYVAALGQKLAKNSSRTNITYSFTLVESPDINAFALPGGYVYVTTGLVKNMDDEAQLAAVIGHEIGHIDRHHSVKALQRQLIAQYGIEYIDAMINSGNAKRSEIAKMAAQIGTSFLFLKNSRENEFEADEMGALLGSKAGYDPNAMVDVQNHLLKLRGAKPSQLEQMLSTHPISEERIARAISYISTKALEGKIRNKTAYDKIKVTIK